MFNFNRKAVTLTIASVFIVTVISMLGKELYETHKEKESLEKEKSELDQEVTDLKEEKGSVESELEEKVEELETSKEKQKKEEKKQEKLKKDNEKKNKEIQNKNEKIKKLEKDLQAKREREKKENESVTTATSVATSNSSEKSVEDNSENNKNSGSGKVFNMDATHYSAFCPTGCTGVTATGDDVSNSIYVRGKRVIAVSPGQIPLGSTVRVTGEGYDFEALALDTGADIGNGRIDILVNSTEEAYSLGRKNVKVEILD